jgi:ATP synthase F1 delta subunit
MSLSVNYAQALYDVAAIEKSVDAVASELVKLNPFFEKKSPSLKLFTSPVLSLDEKLSVLKVIEKSFGLSPLVFRFLTLLIEKDRVRLFPSIVEQFEVISAKASGGIIGVVWSSLAMEQEEIKEIEKSFEKRLGKKVLLKAKQDDSLIAGLRVVIDGVTYDRSVRNQLDRIRLSFLEIHNQ